MENIYEKMARWSEEKEEHDQHFWEMVYPKMTWDNKRIWWRKDVFNAMQRYGIGHFPNEWIAERKGKEPLFEVLLEEILERLQ